MAAAFVRVLEVAVATAVPGLEAMVAGRATACEPKPWVCLLIGEPFCRGAADEAVDR